MAKLHVIYDPKGNLITDQPNLPKGIKVAILPLAEDIQPEDFAKLAAHIAELLLVQFADGSP